jgi:hypothetical protein
MFGEIKVNENGRKWYNKELVQLFEDLDIHSFVRISRLNWSGRINSMKCKREGRQVLNNNSEGSRLRG